jgi:hypothetical protein
MFATLRAGSLLYILNKGEEPSLKVGQVLSVTPPRPKVNTQFMPNPMQMEQVIDITVKVGDEIGLRRDQGLIDPELLADKVLESIKH